MYTLKKTSHPTLPAYYINLDNPPDNRNDSMSHISTNYPFTTERTFDIMDIQTDGGPGSGRYPKGSGGNMTATGTNDIPDMSAETQKKHIKHLKSFGGISLSEYVKRGTELAGKPVEGNIKGYKAANGGIVR